MNEYNSFCNDFEFKDADSTGTFFTWSNASGIIRSKLNRVLVSNTWLQRELECRANFMARGIFFRSFPSHSVSVQRPSHLSEAFQVPQHVDEAPGVQENHGRRMRNTCLWEGLLHKETKSYTTRAEAIEYKRVCQYLS